MAGLTSCQITWQQPRNLIQMLHKSELARDLVQLGCDLQGVVESGLTWNGEYSSHTRKSYQRLLGHKDRGQRPSKWLFSNDFLVYISGDSTA